MTELILEISNSTTSVQKLSSDFLNPDMIDNINVIDIA